MLWWDGVNICGAPIFEGLRVSYRVCSPSKDSPVWSTLRRFAASFPTVQCKTHFRVVDNEADVVQHVQHLQASYQGTYYEDNKVNDPCIPETEAFC